MKRIVVLILVTSLLITICACNRQTTTVSESTTVSTTTLTPTVSPKPTPFPTPTPEPKPTEPLLLPDPVFIPREELPAGQLFAKEYYAVLPGEGAYYNIYDCYGKMLDSFFFNNADIDPPIGLLTSDELAKYYRLNREDVQTVVPDAPDNSSYSLTSYANGFYQKPSAYSEIDGSHLYVYLYNSSGKHIATLSEPIVDNNLSPLVVVAADGGETVVSFQQYDGKFWHLSIYFVAEDGKINNKCKVDSLPDQPYGLLARKYFYTRIASSDYKLCNVYDFSGKLIMTDFSALENEVLRLQMAEGMMNVQINDYILKDGVTLDADFQPVPSNQTEADGSLIYGVEYTVSGIPCQAIYSSPNVIGRFAFDQSYELVAVGTANDQIAIKTKTNEYLLDGKDLEYQGMNNYLAAFQNAADAKKVYSLASGQMIHALEADLNIKMTDNYMLARYYHNIDGPKPGFGIIDNNGDIRYSSTTSYAETTHGDCIVLYRGPYVGIADLNGEWILKSLKWELTRDQDYRYPWD